jgi:hypothetical protein
VAAPLTGLGEAALARGATKTARPLLERALTIRAAAAASPGERAATRFALARALWPEAGDRPRAVSLVEAARAELASADGAEEERQAIDAWLRARAAPGLSPRPSSAGR